MLENSYVGLGFLFRPIFIGVYKQEKDSTLVGHVHIECSTLVDNFLNLDKENKSTALVTGKQKRKVDLVVSAEFTDRT